MEFWEEIGVGVWSFEVVLELFYFFCGVFGLVI